MKDFRRLVLLFWLCVLPLSWGLLPIMSVRPESAPAQSRPRLAVLIFFDQLRADYLTRWDKLFAGDGFHRLERQGAWFQNCRYPYALTVTAAGHAFVVTGCSPERHGIIGNEWYERSSEAVVNCVSAPEAGEERYYRVPRVPPSGPGQVTRKKVYGVSPERLRVATLADALKLSTQGKGRVVALSFKDRSAVLPGGRHPDACYWLDGETGTFVTSAYYRTQLHRWVASYNIETPADRWLGRSWERLRPDLDYTRYSGPDDVRGEGNGSTQGRTFPHPFGAGTSKRSAYYAALYNSPFGNELLLGLAKRAIIEERLGTDEEPDLLCLSFSCNDPVGHCWGPDSQEVLDATLRSDLVVQELLHFLDGKVCRDHYVVTLTADHGVCPLPEIARGQGKEASRILPATLDRDAEAYLAEEFGDAEGKARWIEHRAGPWFYLNQGLLARRGLTQASVEEALVVWLSQQPGIQAAYARSQLVRGGLKDDPVAVAVQRSFHVDRSGDVMLVLKPYHLLTSSLTGTSHGTPHDYDTHVPLLVYGPGIRSGVRPEAVTPQAIATIIARTLGVDQPNEAGASLPKNLFVEPDR